jgi:hypothetical protein
MRATKIKMKPNCRTSSNLLEIDEIYITGCQNEGYFKKAGIHDYLKEHPNEIQVNISPYPNLIPAISPNNEKYVKSTPDSTQRDNLLNLPRE